jgi:hypothetical protein
MKKLKYTFYTKYILNRNELLIDIDNPYDMLFDLHNCNIAYTRTIIKNIQKVIEGRKKMYPFGGSDYCTLDVYKEKTKIIYDFGENETEIDTAEIFKLIQDWYVFLEAHGEKESSYPEDIQYDINYHFFLKEIGNNKKIRSIEIDEPFKILEDFICLSDVSKIKEIIENIQLILELKKQDHYSFESKGSFIVYVLLFKTIISNEQEKKERNIETSDFLKLFQDWLGFLKK